MSKRQGRGRQPIGDRPMTGAERAQRFRDRQKELAMDAAAPLLARHNLTRKRPIDAAVEEIIVKLWEDPQFAKLTGALYDSEAVHRSLDIDDVMAAVLIKETAERDGNAEVAGQNLATIRLAMRAVLKRFRHGRYA